MIGNGCRKLEGVVMGNNSLAVAAACQRGDEEGAQLGRVRWGAVRHEVDGVPGHCTFSGRERVEAPREGDLYI